MKRVEHVKYTHDTEEYPNSVWTHDIFLYIKIYLYLYIVDITLPPYSPSANYTYSYLAKATAIIEVSRRARVVGRSRESSLVACRTSAEGRGPRASVDELGSSYLLLVNSEYVSTRLWLLTNFITDCLCFL